MIFIDSRNPKTLQNIEVKKIGYNWNPRIGDDVEITHSSASCNGCGHSVNGLRFICLSCRKGPPRAGGYVDIC